MKIAIIGAGFCGLAVAWYVLNHPFFSSQLQVHLFDYKGIGQGTSGMASGLLHPFAGAHAKLNWRGKEGFAATQELLNVASQALGYSVTASNGILRLALKSEQIADFQHCAKHYPEETQWLDVAQCQRLAPGCASVPGLWIKTGLIVYSSHYLQGLWQACAKQGALFRKKMIYSLQELQDFDLTIIAAGSEAIQLPELAALPLKLVKGQTLELSWMRQWAPLSCALNSHIYILMTESKTSCLIGATYEKGYEKSTMDLELAQQYLLPKAIEIFPPLKDAAIMNCYVGMRAVTAQHRPLLQRLSSSQWVLTGMGSKGLLYHALFAKELIQKIIEQ